MVLEKERQRQGDMRMGGKPSTKCPITQIFLFLPASLWVVMGMLYPKIIKNPLYNSLR